MRLKKAYFLYILLFSFNAFPALIKINENTYSSKTLLEHRNLTLIKVNDPTYKRDIFYKAIKLKSLVKNVKKDQTLEFKALDGFSSVIPAKALFFQESEPYLAIEDPKSKWPLRDSGKDTAGPFYLIWKLANKERIGQEWWPFQIKSIQINKSIKDRYPRLAPPKLSDSALRGFDVFTKSCFACHQLAGMGEATLGPDLHRPMSPIDYFKKGVLKKFIRNPKSVRVWRDMEMPGFSQKEITDAELDDLISYLTEIRLTIK